MITEDTGAYSTTLSVDELLERCFEQPLDELEPLFAEARRISKGHRSNALHCYVPGLVHYDTPFYKSTPNCFPGISVTGKECQLGCKHCRGKLLERMTPATTPESLYQACEEVKRAGGEGCLVSGGSLKDGSVPLLDFVPTIKRVKDELGLKVVVHTGLVYPSIAEALIDAGIDAAMFDVIGAEDTAKEVYHLDRGIDAFEESLRLLTERDIPVVPHVIVGLHFGKMKGERQALAMIARNRPTAVVVVAFMPLDQTLMQATVPCSPSDIARVVLASRLLMPSTPLLLGCARPAGLHKIETDILAIKAGVDGIAYPSEDACSFAQEQGLDIKFRQQCCSLLWQEALVRGN
ncbi:MAG: radical SAM protein [Chloroflexota bacterium]|nr:MAG: radical SAM protein [Chloroflexota bacterium]